MRATMNISLPESLKEWVEKQVARKGYSTASEFVRDVLRREQEEEARERINSRFDDAIESGKSTPLTAQDWRKTQPQPGPSPALHLPVPTEFKLVNGLKVLLVEDHALPVVTAEVVSRAGSVNNPQDKSGLPSGAYLCTRAFP